MVCNDLVRRPLQMWWGVEKALFCDEPIVEEGWKFGCDDLICDALDVVVVSISQ